MEKNYTYYKYLTLSVGFTHIVQTFRSQNLSLTGSNTRHNSSCNENQKIWRQEDHDPPQGLNCTAKNEAELESQPVGDDST